MAEMIVSKLVLEHQQVEIGDGGVSFGVLVDNRVEQALLAGETLQEITLNIDPAEWLLLRRGFQPTEATADYSEPFPKTSKSKTRSY